MASLIIPTQQDITEFVGAAECGNISSVRHLYDRYGDAILNVTDRDGNTALAATCNNATALECLTFLLEKKANLDKPNNAGDTPLSLAMFKGDLQVAEALLEAGASISAHELCLQARDGFDEGLRLLIKHNANVHCVGLNGWTPLMFAARNNHLEAVNILLEAGVDAARANDKGATALTLARGGGYTKIEQTIQEKLDADLRAQFLNGIDQPVQARQGSLKLKKRTVNLAP